MAKKGFSMEFDAETTACARGADMHCSPKHSRNIAKTIKGMRVKAAKTFLKEVMELKTAVPMTVRNRKIKHRKGMGPGAYPVKAAERVLSVLVNAENNAEYKGLETDSLRVVHATAYRGVTMHRWRPRAQGRATAFNEQTTNLEIVVGDRPDLDEAEEAKADRRAAKRGKGSSGKGKTTAKAKAAVKSESSGKAKDAAGDAPKKAAKKATKKVAKKAATKTAPKAEKKDDAGKADSKTKDAAAGAKADKKEA